MLIGINCRWKKIVKILCSNWQLQEGNMSELLTLVSFVSFTHLNVSTVMLTKTCKCMNMMLSSSTAWVRIMNPSPPLEFDSSNYNDLWLKIILPDYLTVFIDTSLNVAMKSEKSFWRNLKEKLSHLSIQILNAYRYH